MHQREEGVDGVVNNEIYKFSRCNAALAPLAFARKNFHLGCSTTAAQRGVVHCVCTSPHRRLWGANHSRSRLVSPKVNV